MGIGEHGELLVRTAQNEIRSVIGGDVSLRTDP